MAGRPGASKSRSVGRYDLVVEMAKSQLGSLWAASLPGSAGLEPRIVRRLPTPTGKNAEALQQARTAAARWSVDFGVDQAMAVLDVVSEPGELALVSGYVPGETLRALLRQANFKRQEIPTRVALRITLDVCHALVAGEKRALAASLPPEHFYGGLLPDSIVVGSDGISRLLDLGVAAVWRTTSDALSHAEVAAYAAPEQFQSEPVDSRSDVFILGTLLWEMLAGGKRLFVGSSGKAVSDRILNHPAPEVTPPVPGHTIPANVQVLLSRALERDPRKRFRSIDDLLVNLEALQAEIALPIEVSDYVTTFAHNSLSSRERVLDRALNRAASAIPSVAPAPAPQGLNAQSAVPASTPPPPPTRARQASAGRLSSPQLPSLQAPPPSPSAPSAATPPPSARAHQASAARPSSPQLPPLQTPLGSGSPKLDARGTARPLPLPVHARLGARASSPDGVLPPPPPPPVVPKNPKSTSANNGSDDDDSSSVRAADILRALAVEDAEPASEDMPTMRPEPPASPALEAAPAAVALPEPPARPPQHTLRGHASPAPPVVSEEPGRPQQQTLAGYGSAAAPPPSDAPPSVSDERQTLRAPPPQAGTNASNVAVANLVSPATPAPTPGESASLLSLGSAGATGETAAADAVNARTSDDAMTGLPARPSSTGARRLPLPLVAGLGGGALVLLIGLVFAFSGTERGDSSKKAQVQTASSNPVSSPRATEPSPAAAKTPEPPATEAPSADASDDSDSTDTPDAGATSDEPTGEVASDTPTAPTPKPVAQGWSAPAQPAPKPAPPPRKKMRAKRTFIPSGI